MLRFGKIKARRAAALFGLSVALSGCFGEGIFDEKLSQSEPTSVEARSIQEMEEGYSVGEESSMGEGHSMKEGHAAEEEHSVSLAELPEYVFQTGDGKLLLLGDKAVLMDAGTFETEVSKELTGLAFSFQDIRSCKFAASGNEYLVVGNYLRMEKQEGGAFTSFSSSEEPQLVLIRFSKDLEILETLDIGEAMGAKREIDKYEFLCDGTKLLCSSMEGFFLYDLETKTRTIYPLPEELLGIYAFGYLESEDKILFAAFYNDGSQSDSQRVLGSMRLDGTALEYEKKQIHEWGGIWCFEDFALAEEEWKGNREQASAFYYGADGKLKEWTLADEYTAIQPSETGKYFAVQSRDWAENGENTGYTVRVYASESGKMIREIPCPRSEIGQDTMLCECIVSEEAEAVFLLMCDRETEGNARFQVVKF